MKLPSIAIVLALAGMLLVPLLHAASPEELLFQQLKQQRARTVPGASEMLDQRYKTSLEQLLRQPSMSSQPELARQVQAELQATAGARAAAAATAKPAPLIAPATRPPTKTELKKLFENSQWRVTRPDGGKEPVFFTFTKDGQFARSTKGDHWENYRKWEVKAPDVLTVFTHYAKGNKTSFRAFRVDFEHKTARTDANLGGDPAPDTTTEYDQPLNRKK